MRTLQCLIQICNDEHQALSEGRFRPPTLTSRFFEIGMDAGKRRPLVMAAISDFFYAHRGHPPSNEMFNSKRTVLTGLGPLHKGVEFCPCFFKGPSSSAGEVVCCGIRLTFYELNKGSDRIVDVKPKAFAGMDFRPTPTPTTVATPPLTPIRFCGVLHI